MKMRKREIIKFGIIIILSSLILSIGAQENNESISSPDKQFNIDNCVNEFDMDKTRKTKVGYQYWFADKDFIDGRTLKMSVVKPNQATHAPHKHEVDEFFFILEGKANFFLDGETKIVGPYASLYCPPNSEHGISNAGDTELKYLVIKKYPQ
jgi:mannose-6-phosphate isomerase-like protein (cupin superfamily)